MALAEFIVSFREFFEIAAIIGIMLAYLAKAGRPNLGRYIWMGAAAAGLASVAAYIGFEGIAGGFERWEALFEGICLLAAAAGVTSLIFLMMQKKDIKTHLHQSMKKDVLNNAAIGLLLVAFFAVLREGVEIVLFFGGIKLEAGALDGVAVAAGFAAAALLAYLIFASLMRLDIARFFRVTAVLLVLMAGGLVGQGVHELEEAHVLPPIVEHVYDLNPPVVQQGVYPLLHEKGIIGGSLRALVGYAASPSLLQMLAQLGYYGAAYFVYQKISAGSV